MTTAEDDKLSTSRSRQLVSGYHFGNPRAQSNDGEPVSRRASSPGSVHGSDSPPLTEAEAEGDVDVDVDSGDADSPGVSVVPAVRQGPGANGEAAVAAEEEINANEEAASGDVAGRMASLKVGESSSTPAAAAHTNALSLSSRDRRSSRVRDRETGYDRLNGLEDGEADLDETAPQGPGGTEDYLNGLKGYNFPRHRLRTTMKGESGHPILNYHD